MKPCVCWTVVAPALLVLTILFSGTLALSPAGDIQPSLCLPAPCYLISFAPCMLLSSTCVATGAAYYTLACSLTQHSDTTQGGKGCGSRKAGVKLRHGGLLKEQLSAGVPPDVTCSTAQELCACRGVSANSPPSECAVPICEGSRRLISGPWRVHA